MLKVNRVYFQDSTGHSYYIPYYYIQSFPLLGGEPATQVTSRAWSQDGNTFISSNMDNFDSEITFIIYTANMTDDQIYTERKRIVNICNPLNGTVKMVVDLNNGKTFGRDITFTSNPSFGVGFENRNKTWTKVILHYTANNPFWYANEEIVESFSGYHKQFELPYVQMSPSDTIYFGNILTTNEAWNNGQVPAPVKITISGECQNPKILNESTGEYIAFKNLTMTQNDTLFINTEFGKRKVLLNNNNIFHKLDFNSTFFSLKVGQNLINFYDDLFSIKPNILFVYKQMFLTI